MRVYAHWLDGEYRKALTGVTVLKPWSPEDDRAVRLIKTLALFGGSIVLSDVQVVDSPVLWHLFSQPAFLRYLHINPAFLSLIARPVTLGSNRHWAIATAGLERALKVGRIASPMNDDQSVISLSREIVTCGPAVDFDSLLAKRRGSPDLKALSGFIEAVRYFGLLPSRVAEPLPDRPHETYYSILKTALSSPALCGDHRKHAEATLDLVNGAVEDPDQRGRRAIVHEHLDFSRTDHVYVWGTILQAWSIAVQKSVCETGGSIGNMPGVPVGIYVDQQVDFMLAGAETEFGQSKRLLGKLIPKILLDWDPGELDWTDLVQLTEETGVVEAQSDLRQATLTGESRETEAAVEKFVRMIAPKIKGKLNPPVKQWMWALGGVAGGVLIVFGFTEIGTLATTVAIPAAILEQSALVWTVNKLRHRVIAARIVESASGVGLSSDRNE